MIPTIDTLEKQLQESRALLERADMIMEQFYGTVTFYGVAKEARKLWRSEYDKLKNPGASVKGE